MITTLTIRQQAAVCEAAVKLYYAHAAVYGTETRDFLDLTRGDQDAWIARVLEEVEAVGPSRPTRWQEFAEGAGRVISFSRT